MRLAVISTLAASVMLLTIDLSGHALSQPMSENEIFQSDTKSGNGDILLPFADVFLYGEYHFGKQVKQVIASTNISSLEKQTVNELKIEALSSTSSK